MSVRIFPFPTMSGTVSLILSNGGLDGGGWPRVPYVPDRQLVALYDLDKETWSDAEFDVEVTLPAEELAAFEEDGEVKVLLRIECSRTLYREVLPLRRHSSEPNRWKGTLEVSRQNYRGAATVTAVVAGVVRERPDRFVAHSTDWTLHVDEPEARPMTGTMKVRWMDFDHPEEGLDFLKEYGEREFFVDMQSEVPILYLNKSERFEGLPELLDDRRRKDDDRPLHNSERVSVARSVWMGLINASIASIRCEEDTLDWPLEEWKSLVLKRALAKAYPLLSENELLKEACESWKSPERAAELESRLQLAVEDLVSAGKLLRRSLDILKRKHQAS